MKKAKPSPQKRQRIVLGFGKDISLYDAFVAECSRIDRNYTQITKALVRGWLDGRFILEEPRKISR